MATRTDRFPLWLHATGQWAKKIKGKYHYFGTDREAALTEYIRVRADLEAGRKPRPRDNEAASVADLCNHFLTAKRQRMRTGELTARSWRDYYKTAEDLTATFGRERSAADLRPDDFAELHKRMADRLGPAALGNFVQRVRTIFRFAFDSELLATPTRFGPQFAKPSRRTVRLLKADRGERTIEADVVRTLVRGAGSPLDAMILLAVNAGFGQTDLAELPRSALARPGWVDFRRPKTGTPRRCPLWPETIDALEVATANRPAPRDPNDAGLAFLTIQGRRYVRQSEPTDEKPGSRTDALGHEFAKLVRRLKLIAPGFYALRHTFRTVADEILDPVAAGLIMGHVDDSIAGTYRERVNDKRLLAVTDHVHDWLYNDTAGRA